MNIKYLNSNIISMKNLKNKKVLIGISGGIAAYKIASLVNHLIKYGAEVKVIMTKASMQFITPLTFQSLTNNSVYTDMFDMIKNMEIEHISLAKWADIFLIAPATGNTIGKIACGIADNLLTTVAMAVPKNKKIIVAPAMNTEMWNNPIVQKNVKTLTETMNNYVFIEPEKGMLACRDEGVGKIADNEKILEIINKNVK